MKIIIIVTLALAGCTSPPSTASVGSMVSPIYVVDGKTGVCIKLSGYGEYSSMQRAADENCAYIYTRGR